MPPGRGALAPAGARLGQRWGTLGDKIDRNGNGKVNFREVKAFAEDRMAPGTVDALFHADPDDPRD